MRSIDLPNQYQFAAFDPQGNLVHAGVHGAARVSAKAARKNQRKWMAWAATRPDSCHRKSVHSVSIRPIGGTDPGHLFEVPEN